MKANGVQQTLSVGGRTVAVADALEQLCLAYWAPICSYIGRSGFSRQDAEDLTQDFIAWFVAKDHLSEADRDKGKLRSYLIAILRRFLADKGRFLGAKKRGGDRDFVSFEHEMENDGGISLSSNQHTPDEDFDRKWASALMQRAVKRLQQDYRDRGKAAIFEKLSTFLQARPEETAYQDCASALGVTVAAIKMNVMRMRKRYAQLFREEVFATIGDESELEDEIRYLMSLFGRE